MSDDIERERNNLSINGYVHPETPQSTLQNTYKVIDVKDDKATYESSSKLANPYRNFTQNEEKLEKEVQRNDICGQCGSKALYVCECKEYQDMMCENNHVWWVNQQGQIIDGDPHFGEE